MLAAVYVMRNKLAKEKPWLVQPSTNINKRSRFDPYELRVPFHMDEDTIATVIHQCRVSSHNNTTSRHEIYYIALAFNGSTDRIHSSDRELFHFVSDALFAASFCGDIGCLCVVQFHSVIASSLGFLHSFRQCWCVFDAIVWSLCVFAYIVPSVLTLNTNIHANIIFIWPLIRLNVQKYSVVCI